MLVKLIYSDDTNDAAFSRDPCFDLPPCLYASFCFPYDLVLDVPPVGIINPVQLLRFFMAHFIKVPPLIGDGLLGSLSSH